MDEIRSIVVPTDFSALSAAAATRAASFARLDGAAVHLVHSISPLLVDPYGLGLPVATWKELCRAAQEKLEETRRAVEAKGVQNITVHLAESTDVLAGIAEAVEAHGPELVVMGTHGRSGLQRAFLGSVADRALRAIDRPILVVKEDPICAAKPIARILIAVDFSPHSDRALAAAADLAARLDASVEVIHAFHLPPGYGPYASAAAAEFERRIEADVLERLAATRAQLEARKIPVKDHFRRGRPDIVIADAAKQLGCQLIAMGTRGRTGLSHVLLGSVAERTLRAAPCSVLCVKASAAE